MSLPERNSPEWENLCDGCAKCCIFPGTMVACRYLDIDKRRCLAYEFRHEVPHCADLSKMTDAEIQENLPWSCAYSLAIDDQPPLNAASLIATSSRSIGEIRELIESLDKEVKMT